MQNMVLSELGHSQREIRTVEILGQCEFDYPGEAVVA